MNTVKEIRWEKDSQGRIAICTIPNFKKISPMHSKKIAILKMKEVQLISTSLFNEYTIFYEWFWLLWEYKSHIDFAGVYLNSPEEDNTSYICLRKLRWNRNLDHKLLKKHNHQVNDGVNYILSDLHIQSKNIFLDFGDAVYFIELTKNIIDHSKSGLTIENIEREEKFCHYFEGKISDNYMNMNFAYIPNKSKCKVLEIETEIWCQEFNKLTNQSGLKTDDSLKISYNTSLWDNIGYYS